MSNYSKISQTKGVMLGITNKTLPLSIDRLTLNIASSDFEKAKKEFKVLKEHIAEIEKLLGDCDRLTKEQG